MEPSDVSVSEGIQERCPVLSEISLIIDSLEKQVASNCCVHIKRKMEENRQKIIEVTKNMFRSSQERRYLKCSNTDTIVDVLTKRQNDAIDMRNGKSIGENDENNSQEDAHCSAVILLGSSIEVKNAVRPVKLTEVKRLPPYITWTFLDRNQKMHEDKSVRRRRIYYDKSWGETLVASDSDEEAIDEDDEKKEAIDEDEEKKEFVDSEDHILRMTVNKVGLSDAVLDVLAQRFSRKPCEVEARYEVLTNRENAAGGSQNGHREAISSSLLDKDLNAALHSFDNLFCHRCFVFNCGLHGCSKDRIFPAEKQLPWSCPDEGNIPCGLHCYRLISKSQSAVPSLSRGKPGHIESATSNAIDVSESSDSESRPILDLT